MTETITEVDETIIEQIANIESVHRCGRCRGSKNVKPRHCYVKRDGTIVMTCNDKDCQCKCHTHYICKDCGTLAPYDKSYKHVCPEKQEQYPRRKLTKEEQEYNDQVTRQLEAWRNKQKEAEVELTYKEKK